MHFKIDEDLPPAVAEMLRKRGYTCSTVWDQGMNGWKDAALWRAVQDHDQFLITADKGFGDIRAYPPGTHGGVLVLRPAVDGIRPLLELMKHVLASVPNPSSLVGSLAVASPQGLRVRRAPA